jgi:hypothetical protein
MFPNAALCAAFFLSGRSGTELRAGVLRGRHRRLKEGTMFADSLLESNWANRSRHGWTTLASFAAQMLGMVCF